MNLNQMLLQSVAAGPDRTAIVDGKVTVSYGELAALAAAAARMVEGLTDRPHVGVALPPSVSFAISYFGITGAGRTVVPINFLIAESEIEHIISDSGVDTVITTRLLAKTLRRKVDRLVFIEDEIAALRRSAAEVDPGELAGRDVADDAPATILYTSGTSARPKGVVLSHRNLTENCRSSIDALDLDARHVLLAMLPFFHSFGLTTGLLLPLAFGGKTVMLAKFNVPELLSLVEAHKVSLILTIPSIWNAMLRTDVGNRADLSSLEICVSGGEPLPTQTYDRFLERMGFPLSEGYGLTETSPVVSIVPMGDRRRGSAGKPLPRVSVRILDDDGNDLPTDVEGEICIAGPNVMVAYHNLPEETARVMTDDGYFRTGDLGHLDADGFLTISGRKKDLIISAGENISPREIEEVILLHPDVAEVAVLGVPDEMRGEVVKAFVVPKEGAALETTDVRTFCTEHLAGFKVPRHVEFIDALPRGFTGKVLKRQLVQ